MNAPTLNFQFLTACRAALPAGAWNYLVGGADDEITLRRNRQAFQKWALVPRILVDVARIDTAVTFLGIRLPYPIIAAPIGGLTQFHRQGEIEWARGIAAAGTAGTVSGVSRILPSTVINESGATLLYQLYWFGDDDWIRGQVQTAEKDGYRALVLTVDTAHYGQRERDILAGYDPRTAGWRSSPEPPDRSRNSRLNWDDLQRLQSFTSLPVILKGVFAPADIQRAAEAGVKAVWISNHGGRQLDYLPASLDSLVDLAPVCRAAGLAIIFDGGIRRGSEALAALLLGADVVAVGRLPVFGLSVDGAAGVRQVFANLAGEFQRALGLAGFASSTELTAVEPARIARTAAPFLSTKWDEVEFSSNPPPPSTTTHPV